MSIHQPFCHQGKSSKGEALQCPLYSFLVQKIMSSSIITDRPSNYEDLKQARYDVVNFMEENICPNCNENGYHGIDKEIALSKMKGEKEPIQSLSTITGYA